MITLSLITYVILGSISPLNSVQHKSSYDKITYARRHLLARTPTQTPNKT